MAPSLLDVESAQEGAFMSINRLQATVGGLGVDMPARRPFAPRA